MELDTYTVLIEDNNITETDFENTVDSAYKELKDRYYQLFLNVIKNEELEEEYISKSEILYRKIAEEYGYVLASNFINSASVYLSKLVPAFNNSKP